MNTYYWDDKLNCMGGSGLMVVKANTMDEARTIACQAIADAWAKGHELTIEEVGGDPIAYAQCMKESKAMESADYWRDEFLDDPKVLEDDVAVWMWGDSSGEEDICPDCDEFDCECDNA